MPRVGFKVVGHSWRTPGLAKDMASHTSPWVTYRSLHGGHPTAVPSFSCPDFPAYCSSSRPTFSAPASEGRELSQSFSARRRNMVSRPANLGLSPWGLFQTPCRLPSVLLLRGDLSCQLLSPCRSCVFTFFRPAEKEQPPPPRQPVAKASWGPCQELSDDTVLALSHSP